MSFENTKKDIISDDDSVQSSSREPKDGDDYNIVENRTNLIVNYLPQSLSDGELFSLFVSCGPLRQSKIIRDKQTGYSYGYGFVDFMSSSDAVKAISQINGLNIQNKTLKVAFSRPNVVENMDTNLYIANLGSSITKEDIKNMFSSFGKIINMNLLCVSGTNIPRGVAFIRFSSKSEAAAAINAYNGIKLPKCDKPLIVKLAEDFGRTKSIHFCNYIASRTNVMMNKAIPGLMDLPSTIASNSAWFRQNMPGNDELGPMFVGNRFKQRYNPIPPMIIGTNNRYGRISSGKSRLFRY